MSRLLIVILIIITVTSCKKDKRLKCYSTTTTGRIIGFDPCSYYKDPAHVYGYGFVIEIDNGATKDTVANYQIPDGLFVFPPIETWVAYNGDFLFASDLQDRYKISFSYKIATGSELISFVCPGIVNQGPYYQAVKNRQVLISCISKR